ncbi:MAG TPA: hypothetical protein VE974_17510 [Thermoanaerobaculia bacterium]|nr:hypothetical protein [Thermoanaerobaculia bacterium]
MTKGCIAFAVTAALVRLVPLQFLHPLNWDELEFWRATSWIGQGRLPFRDFWEHHTPLMWFLFAPFTWLSDSPGVGAVIALRWAQIPVWIATFWLTNLWMRGAGIERFPRWAAMAVALCSSLLMIPAVEYRVDSLGCMLVMAGLVLAQRAKFFLAGFIFCLAGFANLRLGPVLVVAVLLVLLTTKLRAWPIATGGFTALAACLAFFAATGSLDELVQQVWTDNLAEKFATPVIGGFVHRLLVPFGVRLLATDRLFELAAVDVGGILVLFLGLAGMLLALRVRGNLATMAVLQLTNILFVASMKFIYNYHFALIAIFMIPLVAAVIERVPRRAAVVAVLVLAWSVNAFASIFRGKELDRAYQDLIMREVHARIDPGDRVWSGITWALRAEPAYRFWFLPELARQLVREQLAPPYAMQPPPAAIVFDYNALLWVGTVQRELAPYFIRHYIPVWRELWMPGMNARIPPGRTFAWRVPRDGDYRVYVSAPLARHPWFRNPLAFATYKKSDASKFTIELPEPDAGPVQFSAPLAGLRQGMRLAATNASDREVAVILLPTDDRVLFRQPEGGATLEGETTRVTHVPRLW